MATDSAADQLIGLTLIDTGAPTTPPARRHYWQLPMFVLGLAAAIAAWKVFPPKPDSPGDAYRRDLAALADQLEKKPVDPAVLESKAQKVAAVMDQYPSEAAKAYFLLGSANVSIAENGAPETADAAWLKATEQFTKCESQLLAEKADQARYSFRAAKAAAATKVGHPDKLIPSLAALPTGEDPGERSRLLAETYLRLTPPDIKKARDELTTYLSGSYRANPATAARMKLTLADLCTQLHEPEKTRAWLKEIGTAAPAEMQAMAKVQLARLAVAENKMDDALRLFASAQAIPGLPADQIGMIRYETGRCLVSQKNPTEAMAYFQQASAGGGSAAVASAIKLAELRSQDPAGKGNRAQSAEYLEKAVDGIKSGEFKNPHLSLEDLRNTFEDVIRVSMSEADYEAALRTVNAYASVAENRRDLELRAGVYQMWATALGTKSENALQCVELWRKAATDFNALAMNHPAAPAKLEYYRKAANAFRQAKDDTSAVSALQAIDSVTGLSPELTATVALDRGDMLLASGKFTEACEAFKQAINAGGVPGTQAQLKMARAHLDEGRKRAANPGEARGLIELGQNLLAQMANKTFETAPEREAQQEALYILGKMLMVQNLIESEARFRQLLQLDPAGNYAEEAKLWLGSCLMMESRGTPKSGAPADADKKLAEAMRLFQELSQSKSPKIQSQADMRVVNITLMMKKHDEMPALCNRLTERYRHRPEELIILNMLYASYVQSERGDLASRTIARMQDSFAKIPENEYVGGMEQLTRAYWVSWFEQVKR